MAISPCVHKREVNTNRLEAVILFSPLIRRRERGRERERSPVEQTRNSPSGYKDAQLLSHRLGCVWVGDRSAGWWSIVSWASAFWEACLCGQGGFPAVFCSLILVCPTRGTAMGATPCPSPPHPRLRGGAGSERGMGTERKHLEERSPWGLVQKSPFGKKAKMKEGLAQEQD